jgi:hypothetical protein
MHASHNPAGQWDATEHLFNVESPTPKSDEACDRDKPLLIAMRTASL